MSAGQSGIGRNQSLSRHASLLRPDQNVSVSDSSENEDYHAVGNRTSTNVHLRTESSPSRLSFSSSLNQKTPVRSYFQRSVHGSQGEHSLSAHQ